MDLIHLRVYVFKVFNFISIRVRVSLLYVMLNLI